MTLQRRRLLIKPILNLLRIYMLEKRSMVFKLHPAHILRGSRYPRDVQPGKSGSDIGLHGLFTRGMRKRVIGIKQARFHGGIENIHTGEYGKVV